MKEYYYSPTHRDIIFIISIEDDQLVYLKYCYISSDMNDTIHTYSVIVREIYNFMDRNKIRKININDIVSLRITWSEIRKKLILEVLESLI